MIGAGDANESAFSSCEAGVVEEAGVDHGGWVAARLVDDTQSVLLCGDTAAGDCELGGDVGDLRTFRKKPSVEAVLHDRRLPEEAVMQIGAVFPQTEIGDDPLVIRDWAQAVEGLGYRHLLAFDHVLGAGTDTRPGWRGYTSDTAFHEVFVLFGYLAAITSTVELVTGVLVLPQRQTALVAKQAAEVAVLSGGRLRLGVGVGWNAVEYEALGEAFGDRGLRSEEQVAVLRALWAEPTIDYSGRWHHIDHAGIKPRPRHTIPVWFGGNAEAVLRRVGRIGDGWFPQRSPDDEAAGMLDRIRGYARDAGRDANELGFEPRLTLADVPEEDRADFATGWRGLGATHLCVNTMGLGLATADDHVAALRDALPLVQS
jgi:probable F420-dependent oxidoreductase